MDGVRQDANGEPDRLLQRAAELWPRLTTVSTELQFHEVDIAHAWGMCVDSARWGFCDEQGPAMRVSDAGLQAISRLPGLTSLCMRPTGHTATEEGMMLLASCSKLTTLDLQHNPGVTVAWVRAMAAGKAARSLRRFSVVDPLPGEAMAGGLEGLTHLRMKLSEPCTAQDTSMLRKIRTLTRVHLDFDMREAGSFPALDAVLEPLSRLSAALSISLMGRPVDLDNARAVDMMAALGKLKNLVGLRMAVSSRHGRSTKECLRMLAHNTGLRFLDILFTEGGISSSVLGLVADCCTNLTTLVLKCGTCGGGECHCAISCSKLFTPVFTTLPKLRKLQVNGRAHRTSRTSLSQDTT
eukprot:CAMPEP_0114327600 /NCGR_PEP_ID=MMETSP0059-20121206/30384_1 /TAXON_ID=36894 /ORGANISM="Pyramimonas parkeae, Strain CCMP726" /LENGTH=352 /DNA_ID=CAMNT_0001456731 /DNA_START=208 /DNA_END=1266 /DNA_ORIENTATION=+